MPNWKKVIVSGSNAVLNQITASGNVSGSSTSTASFGTYIGDGSQLTGISSGGTNLTQSIFVTQNGDYFLTVTNQNGCTSNSDTINYNTLNIDEVIINFSKVFPNPVKDQLKVESQTTITTINLYDVNGKLIQKLENINQTAISINTLKLSNGIYYLKLSTSEAIDVQKIVIQH